jgi:hypothetical protein
MIFLDIKTDKLQKFQASQMKILRIDTTKYLSLILNFSKTTIQTNINLNKASIYLNFIIILHCFQLNFINKFNICKIKF